MVQQLVQFVDDKFVYFNFNLFLKIISSFMWIINFPCPSHGVMDGNTHFSVYFLGFQIHNENIEINNLSKIVFPTRSTYQFPWGPRDLPTCSRSPANDKPQKTQLKLTPASRAKTNPTK